MNSKKFKRKNSGRGSKVGHGFLDKLIDKLPIELHLPNYRFCGPVSFYNEKIKYIIKKENITQLKHFYYIIHRELN